MKLSQLKTLINSLEILGKDVRKITFSQLMLLGE